MAAVKLKIPTYNNSVAYEIILCMYGQDFWHIDLWKQQRKYALKTAQKYWFPYFIGKWVNSVRQQFYLPTIFLEYTNI